MHKKPVVSHPKTKNKEDTITKFLNGWKVIFLVVGRRKQMEENHSIIYQQME